MYDRVSYKSCAAGESEVSYLETGRMLADTLTKPLQGAVFNYLTRRITGVSEASRHRGGCVVELNGILGLALIMSYLVNYIIRYAITLMYF